MIKIYARKIEQIKTVMDDSCQNELIITTNNNYISLFNRNGMSQYAL